MSAGTRASTVELAGGEGSSPSAADRPEERDGASRASRRPATSGSSSSSESGRSHRRIWWIAALVGLPVLGVLAAVVLSVFVAEVVVVPTTSMLPTIHPGNLVLVDKLAYANHGPRLGDIVVFDNPEYKAIPKHSGNPLLSAWRHQFAPVDRVLIKRVIGLPGQVVQVTRNAVLINGKVLREPWLASTAQGKTFGPYRVPPNEYFVMGDNRTHSIDSRYFPEHAVKRRYIIGKAIYIVWPPGQVRHIG